MNLRRSFAALAVCLLALSFGRRAEAKLEGPKWVEAEKAFRALYAYPGEADKKIEAAKPFFEETDARAFRLIADGVTLEVGHATKTAADLGTKLNRLQILLGKKSSEQTGNDQNEMWRLQDEVSVLEKTKGEDEKVIRTLVGFAAEGVEGFRREIIKVTRASPEWPMRAVAARVAARAPDEEASKPALVDLLEKEKDPRVKIAALESLEKAPGTSWHGLLAARCEDPDWSVQLVAARIAGEREIGRAIPNLIKALAKAPPRVGDQIVASLRKLTGQSIEAYAEPWAKWWEAHRAEWGEDGRPLQPVVAAPRPSDVEFYGLKIRSDKVLYIIDISGSMQYEKKAKAVTAGEKPGMSTDPTPDASAPRFSGTKIEIAKLELKRSLARLTKDSMFDIIAFNHTVLQWQPKMVQATDANKELAYAWIRDMAPSGSTFCDGALQMAFKMGGMGLYDKNYPGVAFDTIILLSDGAPTDNSQDGKLMDFNIILQHVAEWNPQKRVVIHCVGIDNVVQGVEFMKKLAAQNGGVYIDG